MLTYDISLVKLRVHSIYNRVLAAFIVQQQNKQTKYIINAFVMRGTWGFYYIDYMCLEKIKVPTRKWLPIRIVNGTNWNKYVHFTSASCNQQPRYTRKMLLRKKFKVMYMWFLKTFSKKSLKFHKTNRISRQSSVSYF